MRRGLIENQIHGFMNKTKKNTPASKDGDTAIEDKKIEIEEKKPASKTSAKEQDKDEVDKFISDEVGKQIGSLTIGTKQKAPKEEKGSNHDMFSKETLDKLKKQMDDNEKNSDDEDEGDDFEEIPDECDESKKNQIHNAIDDKKLGNKGEKD